MTKSQEIVEGAGPLLPCPFDGGPVDMIEEENADGSKSRWFAVCRWCYAETYGNSEVEARDRWNRRVKL